MKAVSVYRIMICLVALFVYHGTRADTDHERRGPLPEKEWTFLVYMAADNNLEAYVDENIAGMEQIGTTDQLNILVYACTHRPNERKMARKLLVKQGFTHEIDREFDKDSGSEQTLVEAYEWAAQYFPAKRVVLVIWDHGTGPLNRYAALRGVCYDDTTGNYLTDAKLHKALHTICVGMRGGKPLDVVAFDACLMSSLETAYTLQPYAKYMIASEQTIYAKGFDYEQVLKPLAVQPTLATEAYAEQVVKAFEAFYGPKTANYTLTALRLDQSLQDLAIYFNECARHMRTMILLPRYANLVKAIKRCRERTVFFTDRSYRDLGDFLLNLLHSEFFTTDNTYDYNKQKLRELLIRTCQAFGKVVVHHVAGNRLKTSSGMFVYFPDMMIHSSYPHLLWTKKNPQWAHFIDEFTARSKLEDHRDEHGDEQAGHAHDRFYNQLLMQAYHPEELNICDQEG